MKTLEEMENEMMRDALMLTDGNTRETAEVLGCSIRKVQQWVADSSQHAVLRALYPHAFPLVGMPEARA